MLEQKVQSGLMSKFGVPNLQPDQHGEEAYRPRVGKASELCASPTVKEEVLALYIHH